MTDEEILDYFELSQNVKRITKSFQAGKDAAQVEKEFIDQELMSELGYYGPKNEDGSFDLTKLPITFQSDKADFHYGYQYAENNDFSGNYIQALDDNRFKWDTLFTDKGQQISVTIDIKYDSQTFSANFTDDNNPVTVVSDSMSTDVSSKDVGKW